MREFRFLNSDIFSVFKGKSIITSEMKSKLFVSMFDIAKCSVDGENWYEISEVAALCCINEHYASRDLDAVLQHYNKGHIVPVEYVLYKKE